MSSKSELLRKLVNYKEVVCHMKKTTGISSFSKFQKVWMKNHQSTSFQKLRKSRTNVSIVKSVSPVNHTNSVNCPLTHSASFQIICSKRGNMTTFEVLHRLMEIIIYFNQSIDFLKHLCFNSLSKMTRWVIS